MYMIVTGIGRSTSITVRFTTQKGELFTSDLDVSGIGFRMLFERGDRVSLIYDPSNPNDYTLSEAPSDVLANAGSVLVGLIFLAAAA